ncbi:DNA-binding response regulator [Terrimonas sp.]|uniref:LytR/AlgR family response regulator transcription factor n=1 Tax=Terrimonas sp. TaxID=1914338 RepID=UPI000D5063D5|nr:LytTR family DNA-binding domain-containing protein [Terrimonas sp.]PVD52436.1 DNA-binding response regulator [Terrimonas sp.]
MLRCLAIDDEPLALELLEDNISKVPFLELTATCSNPVEAMKVLQEKQIDLIFLDIQMPRLTGLQFLQSLVQKPMVIMITAYEKYALEGFNLDVVDYLVKPVSLDRFIKSCNKAWELHQLKEKAKSATAAQLDYIFVNADYSLIKIVLSDITWIEGLKDYLKINLHSTNKPFIVRMGMKNIEDMLPAAQFIRIHRSYIISKKYITAVRKNSIFLGQIELPISSNYRDAVSAITGFIG